MYSKLKLVCIGFLFISVFSTVYAADTTQHSNSEIQVLIDVSGSMKKNDPKNLRIPAVKLLINLLPEGIKAGIWLFAQKSSVIVETGLVNQQWKKNALAKISKIHSSGLLTNIEEAIELSASDWFNSTKTKQNRHLILLTDGMVDVSKDIMQSAESRERILVEKIPLLQQAGVKILAIALSEYADAALLNKLAFDTNGWFEIAKSADQLQKVFFKIFKKAIPQDSVPLKDNAFTVDSTIKEFSILIFKKMGAPVTALLAPDMTKILSAKHDDTVAWLDEKNYDLVTIKKPLPGKWKIEAEMDPDNEVMIVTDLKFQLDEIPNHISEKEPFNITAYFSDQGHLISREDFLKLVDISIQQTDEFGGKNKWKMEPVNDKPGLFSKTLGTKLGKGQYSIRVLADGKTFQREIVQSIEVVESLIEIKTDVNIEERTVRLRLVVDEDVINTEKMAVQVTISQPNHSSEHKAMEKMNGKWELIVEAPNEGERKVVNFSVMAKTREENSVSPDIKPIVIDDSLFAKPDSKQKISKVAEEEISESVEKIEGETDDKKAEEIVADPVNWVKTIAIVIGINIFIFVVSFFLFRLMKKKAEEKQLQLLERIA